MDTPFPKDVTIKQAVLSTLAYFDIFGIFLTEEDVLENLLFIEPSATKVAIYLKESPLVQNIDSYYSISKNPEIEDEFRTFLEKKNRTRKYWRHVKRFCGILNLCPFVRLITVCNSLPIGDINKNSDIDLFVVAKPNRLFTARLFLTILTSIFGLRRYGIKIKKRFCLSFYASEDSLDLSSIAQKPYDIYLAYWLKTMEPICGDYSVYQKLIAENSPWLKDFFYSVPPLKRYFRKKTSLIKKILEKLLDWDSLEIKQKRYQLKRAQAKYSRLPDKSGTIISDTILKFHDFDARATVRSQWMNRLSELLRVF
jgi:hypothetical protein